MDDRLYSQLKEKWKQLNILDELSLTGSLQDEKTWDNPEYDSEILNTAPVITFTNDFPKMGKLNVGLFKTNTIYIFINLENKEKISEMEYKTIDILLNGKLQKNVECSYKSVVISNYRGIGFSYVMIDTLLKNNTAYPGLWASDTKLSPINQKVWKNCLKKYKHEFLISNGKNPPLWIPTSDMRNIEKFRLRKISREVLINPEKVWEEEYDEEQIRVLLKA